MTLARTISQVYQKDILRNIARSTTLTPAKCCSKIIRPKLPTDTFGKSTWSTYGNIKYRRCSSVHKMGQLQPGHNGRRLFQRQLISALYPLKLEYDGCQFRTVHLQEVIATTFSPNAAFQKKKKRTKRLRILPALKRGLEQILAGCRYVLNTSVLKFIMHSRLTQSLRFLVPRA